MVNWMMGNYGPKLELHTVYIGKLIYYILSQTSPAEGRI